MGVRSEWTVARRLQGDVDVVSLLLLSFPPIPSPVLTYLSRA